jgi:TetR/AcrR family transcriptional regulator, cholesterol catabolism regulator
VARKPADQTVHPQAIIEAAADVLQRNGYEATTMKDIAAAVNLTAASLYHHFRNKDTLLLAVLEAGITRALAKIDPIVTSSASATERLQQMMCIHIIELTENTAVGAAMVFEIQALMRVKPPTKSASADEQAAYQDFITRRDHFFQQRDHFERLFRKVISEGVERGEFRADCDVAIFTKTMLGAHNWVSVWYRPGGRLNGEQIANLMIDTFLRALKV